MLLFDCVSEDVCSSLTERSLIDYCSDQVIIEMTDKETNVL